MPKHTPYLMVSLEESESKALAQVLSNDTSRAIMRFLTERDNATESDIATALNMPLSTVHYNIQNLVKARLVKPVEFHYSEKGKEVLHYALSNKIIVIAPSAKKGFEMLKRLLPSVLVVGCVAGALTLMKQRILNMTPKTLMAAQEYEMAAGAKAAPIQAMTTQPFYTSIIFWFLIGAALALTVYAITDCIIRKYNKP
ncbi:hypothetical protein DRJ48_02625 [Candidatus Woesearchaeota archaeon]|nr:helix-turn-helix domain-containing protein [Candidatus Woesearchaeota archaeon]RLE42846.1 MAG: hypothetical protein DRJ48_02625 [Candidatus Woesearchaeota archaeon]